MEQGAVTVSGTADPGWGWQRIPVVSLRRNLNATLQGLQLLDQTEPESTGLNRVRQAGAGEAEGKTRDPVRLLGSACPGAWGGWGAGSLLTFQAKPEGCQMTKVLCCILAP